MRLITKSSDAPTEGRPVCVAIGVFDGVHLGHQEVIRRMVTDAAQLGALAVAVTFDRHPKVVVDPSHTPRLIEPPIRKLRLLEALGVELTWLIHFDEEFSRQSGAAFVEALVRDFAPLRSVCVGSAFTFGHQRGGNVALLEELGPRLGFITRSTPPVSLEGQPVSSSRIRAHIHSGDLESASGMLGRPYQLTGPVVHGAHLGRELGFPTANLDVDGMVLPPTGVYAVEVFLAGVAHPGVMNLGRRPTVASPSAQLIAEVHLIGFSGDLYGQEIEVIPTGKLRDEKRFSGTEALRAQIQEDVRAAECLLAQSARRPQA